MSILFAGGGDSSFTHFPSGTTNTGTTGGGTLGTNSRFRTNYATAYIGTLGNSGSVDPPTYREATPTFTSSSIVWFHGLFNTTSTGSIAGMQCIRFLSPDGVCRIIVRLTGTLGTLKVSSRNSAGTITDLATGSAGAYTSNILYKIDVKVDYSASGSIVIYINGSSVLTYSGDPRTDAATQLYQVEFATMADASIFVGSSSDWWSEIIVADEDTRGLSLWTLLPQAAGNTQSWTPNTLANIKKDVIDDATFISSSSNNELSQWTTPTTAPTGVWSVRAIVQEVRVQVGTTGPQHFDWSLRTASTDFLAGTSNAPGLTFGNFRYQWNQNPNTSSDWVVGDIAAGFNLGIKSLA